MAAYFAMLPKKPRNEAERRRAKPLLWACLLGAPLGIATDLFAAFKVHDKYFKHVSDDAFAYCVVAGMVIFAFAFVGILFTVFFTVSEVRRRLAST